MQRHITPIPCKPWTVNGLSDGLLVSHYENNYGAAVRSLNSIWGRLSELDPTTAPDYEIRALKRPSSALWARWLCTSCTSAAWEETGPCSSRVRGAVQSWPPRCPRLSNRTLAVSLPGNASSLAS